MSGRSRQVLLYLYAHTKMTRAHGLNYLDSTLNFEPIAYWNSEAQSNVQTSQSICSSPTQGMKPDEDSEQTLDIWPRWIRHHRSFQTGVSHV